MLIKDVNGNELGQNPQVLVPRVGFDAPVADQQGQVSLDLTEAIKVANTNGTTAVSVFGSAGLPYSITITGVFLVAQDTTTGNITLEAPASTVVCTVAKGATAGALVGATTLSNTTVAAGTNVVVDSSSAGNARVFITYKKA
jgi:hypothetical protein